MESYYFDTSIWLDIYEKRGENGEAALNLIFKIILEGDVVLISHIILKELKKLGYSNQNLLGIFKIAKSNSLRMVHTFKNQEKEARGLAKIRNLPLGDVLHAILARDNFACLVTRVWYQN